MHTTHIERDFDPILKNEIEKMKKKEREKLNIHLFFINNKIFD